MPKILAIDDKQDNLIALSSLLMNLIPDCNAIVADSGEVGIEKAKAELPDTILLDIKMPGMDGFEVCRVLKNDEKTKHIPVIMTTAIKTDSKSRVKGFELGADTFLSKPIDEIELAAQIKAMLRIKKAEDALRGERDLLEDLVKEKTKSLRESEAFLDATGQIAKVGGWQIDGETKKVFWTQEIYNITEVPYDYDPSSLGKEAIVFFNAEDQIRLNKAIQRALEHNEPYNMEFQITTGKGNKKWVQAICKPITVDGKTVKLTGTFQEITERKQAEDQIKASLKEKEALLSEIHHRVKNNMQVIVSLLKLQADKIEDKKYGDMLQESQNRILSMALVHKQLYQSKDFANIDFGEYVKSFVNTLFVSYEIDTNKVKLNVETKDVSFDLENAIPCGLIINELVSNSLKHAFPNQEEGNISIALQSVNEYDLELTVSDDGVGIPEDLDIEQTDTMGLHLVKVIAEQQLEGKMELNRTKGTQFHFLLKRAKYKPRI